MLRILMLFVVAGASISVLAEEYTEPKADAIKQQALSAAAYLDDAEALTRSEGFASKLQDQVGKMSGIANMDRGGVGFTMPDYIGEMNESGYMDRAMEAANNGGLNGMEYQSSFFALISFSMPIEEVIAIARQVKDLGGVVVIRGLVDGDMNATIEMVTSVVESVEGVSISVDPTIFSRFSIDRVPAYVISVEPLKRCTPNGCDVPEHVSAVGSVSAEYFLSLVSRVGETDGARLAAERILEGDGK